MFSFDSWAHQAAPARNIVLQAVLTRREVHYGDRWVGRYELIYLVQPEAEDEARETASGAMLKILEDSGATFIKNEDWGSESLRTRSIRSIRPIAAISSSSRSLV